MKLIAKQFQVLNYRNIDDSGWIPLERVTAFVGRNESGKTALLKALHKVRSRTTHNGSFRVACRVAILSTVRLFHWSVAATAFPSGKLPEYLLIDESEVCLTIPAGVVQEQGPARAVITVRNGGQPLPGANY